MAQNIRCTFFRIGILFNINRISGEHAGFKGYALCGAIHIRIYEDGIGFKKSTTFNFKSIVCTYSVNKRAKVHIGISHIESAISREMFEGNFIFAMHQFEIRYFQFIYFNIIAEHWMGNIFDP